MIMPSLAGTTRLSCWSFALLDGLGAALWVGVAIGSGMLFHHEIGRLIGRLQELGAIAVGAIGVLLAGYIAIKWWQRRRFYNRLRMARITVDELHRLMAEGQRPVIVDLRTSLARDQDSRFVPGALMADFAEADQWLDQVPTDREVIFYCTCPKRIAFNSSLMRKGGLSAGRALRLNSRYRKGDCQRRTGFRVSRRLCD